MSREPSHITRPVIARLPMPTFWRRHDRPTAHRGDTPVATERLWQWLGGISPSKRQPNPTLEAALVRQMVLPMACLAVTLGVGYSIWQWRALDALFEAQGRNAAWQVAVSVLAAASAPPSADGLQPRESLPSERALQAALRSTDSLRIEIRAPERARLSAGLSLDALYGLRRFVVAWPPADGSAPSPNAAAVGPHEAATPAQPPAASAHWEIAVWRDPTGYRRAQAQAVAAAVASVLLLVLCAWVWARRSARAMEASLHRLDKALDSIEAGHSAVRYPQTEPATASAAPTKPAPPPSEFLWLGGRISALTERLNQRQHASAERVRQATAAALARLVQVEQVELSRARQLSATGHDLRQPLHAMGLLIDGLLDSASTSQLPALERLRESTLFINSLFDDLREISQLDASVVPSDVTTVSMAAVFERLQSHFSNPVRASRLELRWRARGFTVQADPQLLHRLLQHLVDNALYRSEGGKVMVAVRRAGPSTVQIEVRDSGIGMAPIHHQRIFEEFYQVPDIEPSRRRGFGLGLAIAARIAHLMGTHIQLRSALHLGSTFAIKLPGSGPSWPSSRQAAEPHIDGITGSQPNCLIIDDDPHTLEKHRVLLERWGYRVTSMSSLVDAATALNAYDASFQAVLSALASGNNAIDDGTQLIDVVQSRFPGALLIHIGHQPSAAQTLAWRERGVAMLPWPVAPAKLRALLSTRWPLT